MNPRKLFCLLAEGNWTLACGEGNLAPQALAEFGDVSFEYLLRFCEVNRVDFIGRLRKQESALSVEVLMYRILLALCFKWHLKRDYRYLNLLAKFHSRKYIRYLPNDSEGNELRDRIERLLGEELHVGK